MMVCGFLEYDIDKFTNEILGYTLSKPNGKTFTIPKDRLIKQLNNNEIFITNKELTPDGHMVDLGEYDFSNENFIEYKKYSDEYKSKYNDKDLIDEIDNYIEKLSILGVTEYNFDFRIINEKIFITRININDVRENLLIDIPDFVFGFLMYDTQYGITCTNAFTRTLPKVSIELFFNRPVVLLSKTRLIQINTNLRDVTDEIEFKTITGGMFRRADLARLKLHNFKAKFCKLDSMFGTSNIGEIDLGDDFDTCGCRSTYGMFGLCLATKINLGKNFDTSNVVNMESMFSYCSNLEALNIGSKFDTRNAKNMQLFMAYNYGIKSINLGDKFDLQNAVTLDYMFSSNRNLDNLYIKSVNNTKYISSIDHILDDGQVNYIKIDDNIDFSNIEYGFNIFHKCKYLNQLDLREITDDIMRVIEIESIHKLACISVIDLEGLRKFNPDITEDKYANMLRKITMNLKALSVYNYDNGHIVLEHSHGRVFIRHRDFTPIYDYRDVFTWEK